MTRLRSAGRRRTGRAIRAVNEMAQQAAREERMIELMIDAFGASAEERKRLEALIRSQFPETVARLRRRARAPKTVAEMTSEQVHLMEEMGRQRREHATQYRGGKGPPQAKVSEHEGVVDIAGKPAKYAPDGSLLEPGQPSPQGYLLEKDLVRQANLSPDQVFLLQEVVGRPLGVISVFPKGFGPPRGIDLAEMWNKAKARGGAAERAGQKQEAAALRTKTETSARAADRLRRDAKRHGDDAYALVRSKFWDDIRANPDLVAHFEQKMGLKFRRDTLGNPTGAPYLDLGNGREGLTLEHMLRRNDDPRLAIDPKNLSFSPWTENVMMSEGIRNFSPLEWR